MSELRKCCEFCEFNEFYEYEHQCASCRPDKDSPRDYRNFEIAKELLEWKGVSNV